MLALLCNVGVAKNRNKSNTFTKTINYLGHVIRATRLEMA